ncbi:MAG: DinB family protein [Acidobacteria bacterium]|nr:DinB family protein [Acidobacteriota bacterium]
MYKPEPNEYGEYYGEIYLARPRERYSRSFARQPAELRSLFDGVGEEKGVYRYAEGKWTTKESLSHLIDGERIFAYRMLRISRGDETPIEGFEQDGYIENSNANNRSFADLLDEFELNRKANVLFLNNLDETGLARMGTASGSPVSVRGTRQYLYRAWETP